MNFTITDKYTNVETRVTDIELKKKLSEFFPDAGENFYKFLFNRIVSSPSIPYSNNRLTISVADYTKKTKKLPRWDGSVPANLDRDQVGGKKLRNDWILFNTKTEKSYAFNNLSALSRALNIDYAWLYVRVAFANSFKLKHYILTRSSMLEKEFYHDKVSEVL